MLQRRLKCKVDAPMHVPYNIGYNFIITIMTLTIYYFYNFNNNLNVVENVLFKFKAESGGA